MILSCCGPYKTCNCDIHFQPVLTDLGICFALNPTPLNQSFKESPYIDMIKTVFEHPQNDPDETNCSYDGSSYEMHIILDSHQTQVC